MYLLVVPSALELLLRAEQTTATLPCESLGLFGKVRLMISIAQMNEKHSPYHVIHNAEREFSHARPAKLLY